MLILTKAILKNQEDNKRQTYSAILCAEIERRFNLAEE